MPSGPPSEPAFFLGIGRMKDMTHLEQLCEKSLQAVGYDLVDMEYRREQQGWILRVYIDHPWGGEIEEKSHSTITHRDCEIASRHLSTVLDVEDPIDTHYRLEVSSPGIQRPIRKERDFTRFCGELVRIQMEQPICGKKNFLGHLRRIDHGIVTLEMDGERFELPLDRIKKARLEVEL